MLTASFNCIQAVTSILALLSLAQGSTPAGGANAAVASSSLPAPATGAISPMTPPPPPSISSTTFSRHERLEHDLVWRVIKKYCSGCWSGTLRTYRPLTRKNQIALVRPDESPLNFRLRVATTGAVGTWNVWNLARRGDETIVPLRQTPLVRLPQVKVGFDEGIILRIPRDMGRFFNGGDSQPPHFAFEIGFWDASMRRTTVVQYQRQRQPWMTRRRRPWHLLDIIVIQQRREHERRSEPKFVGNTTDPEALLVLPEAAPFRLKDCNIDSFHLHAVESVNLQTMERQKRKIVMSSGSSGSCDDDERRLLEERIARAFTTTRTTGLSNGFGGRRIFRSVLPNQMLVSLPTSFSMETIRRDNKNSIENNLSSTSHDGPKSPLRTMFALWPQAYDDRRGGRDNLQVVEVTYDAATGQGLAVTLYSLRENKPE